MNRPEKLFLLCGAVVIAVSIVTAKNHDKIDAAADTTPTNDFQDDLPYSVDAGLVAEDRH